MVMTSRRALALLALAVALYGVSWPVMKLGLVEGTPLWFAAARALTGAAASAALLAGLGRLHLPLRGDLPLLASISLVQIGGFYGFSMLGLAHVEAGRSVVLAYTTALWVAPLSLLFGERLGRRQLAGLALGLVGMGVLLNPQAIDWRAPGILAGHCFLLLAALAWGITILHARHHCWQSNPFDILPWQMGIAGLALGGLAGVFEPQGGIDTGATALAALFFVGAVVGPVGTWAVTTVARCLPSLSTSLGLLGVPVLGVAASAVALGEEIGPGLLIGGMMILGGVALVSPARRPQADARRFAPPAPGSRRPVRRSP